MPSISMLAFVSTNLLQDRVKNDFFSKIMCIPIKEPAGLASSTIGAEDGFCFKKEMMMRT